MNRNEEREKIIIGIWTAFLPIAKGGMEFKESENSIKVVELIDQAFDFGYETGIDVALEQGELLEGQENLVEQFREAARNYKRKKEMLEPLSTEPLPLNEDK